MKHMVRLVLLTPIMALVGTGTSAQKPSQYALGRILVTRGALPVRGVGDTIWSQYECPR